MYLQPDECYHIYNRGNNQQTIFFSERNYLFFIKKIREQLSPCADIISYCLMPNHFHIIIHANNRSIIERKSFGGKPMQEFAYRIGLLLSSYSQAINKQNKTSGSLFQQKTKAKILSEVVNDTYQSYLENCFFYVHNNPLDAGLVKNLRNWPYSSYIDYTGERNGTLSNMELFYTLTGLNSRDIVNRLYCNYNEELVQIFY